jgi:hypothetical protein
MKKPMTRDELIVRAKEAARSAINRDLLLEMVLLLQQDAEEIAKLIEEVERLRATLDYIKAFCDSGVCKEQALKRITP